MRWNFTIAWMIYSASVWCQIGIVDTLVQVDSILVRARAVHAHQSLESGDDLDALIGHTSTNVIRSYGPGQLSTWSVRGSSAGQNSVYWNELEISSPMLGQIDFNQLSHGTHNRVNLSSFGEGNQSTSIGGQLDLKTSWDESSDGHLDLGVEVGSFDSYASTILYKIGQGTYRSRTSAHFSNSKNDFPFINYIGEQQNMDHADHKEWSLAHSSHWSTSSLNVLEAHIWLRGQDLNIGPAIHQSESEATQADHNYRFALNWKSKVVSWNYAVTAGFLHDRIRYKDPLIQVNDPAQNSSYLLDINFNKNINSYYVKFGYDLKYSSAQSANYNIRQDQNIHKAFAHVDKTWNSKSQSALLINQFILDGNMLTPTFRLSHTYNWTNNWSLVGRAARAIRIPTLNDLYWSQGGNPDLDPEVAWKGEVGLYYDQTIGSVQFKSDIKFFTTHTQDWILWQPVSGILWSPINIRQVWSRGVNPSIALNWMPAVNQELSTSFSYEWVKATYQNTLSVQDVSLGKQIIYTPEHTMLFDLEYRYKNWAVRSTSRYTSKTYTSRDNLRSLPNYLLTDFTVSRQLTFFGLACQMELGILNMTNSSYQVIASRAMPLRNFYLKLNINPF